MKKAWNIFWFEYRLRVWNWRFVLGLISGPLFIGLVILFAGARLKEMGSDETNAMGVVDNSGTIARAEMTLGIDLVQPPLVLYTDETIARQAADENLIQGYYVFSESFAEDGDARLVLKRQGGVYAQAQVENVARVALLADAGYDSQQIMRIVGGGVIDYEPLDVAAENLPEDDAARSNAPLIQNLLGIVGAYFLLFIFFFALNLVNGYVVRILLEERENRTLEILVTSVGMRKFLGAKVFANVMVGLTQVMVWIILGVAAIILISGSTRFFASVGALQVALAILYLLLGIIFVAGINSMIASLVPKPQLASMLTGVVTLPTMIPFLAIQAISESPNSALAVVLSIFPVTAIQAVPARLFFTIPPWWELLISLLLLALAAYFALRLAGWAFQLSVRSGGNSPLKFKPFWRRRARGDSHAQ